MKLSSKLLKKIENNPLDTYLRNVDYQTNQEFEEKLTSHLTSTSLPSNFDGRKVWNTLLTIPKNQGSCGSCWAFATSGTLADRFNIHSMGLIHLDLSPTKMILCDFKGDEFESDYSSTYSINKQLRTINQGACFGNTLVDAWRFLFVIGTNTSKCIPYAKSYGKYKEYEKLGSFTTPLKMPLCKNISGKLGDMCADHLYNEYEGDETGTPARFYRALHYYSVPGVPKDGGDEANIRHEIFNQGPVSTAMEIYPSFYTFNPKSEIYKAGEGGEETVGGHAVEIVGWGEEGGTKFWIIKNSWGIDWGDKGYFKMIRGNNNCKIEENVMTCQPDFFYPTNYKSIITQSWGETPQSIEKRRQITSNLQLPGGGINPETGYSRRVMTVYPTVNLGKPISIENLPNFKNWVAGINANKVNRNKYRKMLEQKYGMTITVTETNEDNTTGTILVIIFGVIILCLIIFFTIKKFLDFKNNF